ncbi:MFS transporter [Candidatus Bipolaricaulota bacterium]|nr:MFS transporter [Candidatus Bipolaricaulota bacterium]
MIVTGHRFDLLDSICCRVYAPATVEENSQPYPGGRRRAIPLAASSLLVAISVGGLGLVVQLYLKFLNTPLFFISFVSTLGFLGSLFGAWFWGTISDFVKRRRLLAFLTGGLSASILVLASLPSSYLVLASEMLRAIMFAGVTTVSIAVVSASSLPQRRGKNLSYVSASRSLGFAAGNMMSGFILERFGFSPTFILFAVLGFSAFGVIWLLPNENPIERKPKVKAWNAISTSGLFDLYLATALRQMAIAGTFSLLYIYMGSVGVAVSVMGIISGSNTAFQVPAILIFGWLADRMGRRRIFMLGFLFSAITPLVFVFAANTAGMIAGYMTLGLSFSSMYVGATAFIGDRVPQERHGQMMGLYESSRSLGGIFGPMIAGVTAPLIGFRGMFLVMAAIGGAGFLVMVVGRLRGRARRS